MRSYKNQPSGTVVRARDLRRNSTDAERILWRSLRDAFPTLKWRRQVPIGPYSADFLSIRAKLIVEVDGSQHADAEPYDARCTRFLESEGYQVLRLWKLDVMQNLEGSLTQISFALREKSDGSGLPPTDPEQRGTLFTRHWARATKSCGTDEGVSTKEKGAVA